MDKNFIVAGARASIKHIYNKFGNTPLVGAEIGVFRGQHAQSILDALNMEKLYLVDPWDFFCPWKENHTAPRWIPGRKGEKVTHLQFFAGHTHEITYDTDKEGQIKLTSIKCGPALKQSTKRTPSGKASTTLVEAFLGTDPTLDPEDKKARIYDRHIHVFKYWRSELTKVKEK